MEAPSFRLFRRGDQDALDFDPAPKFLESLPQPVVRHVPVGAPIEVEQLEFHAPILVPTSPPTVLRLGVFITPQSEGAGPKGPVAVRPRQH